MAFVQQATGEVITRPCMLPAILIEARAAVFDPMNCLDLGTTARRVLFGILSFFNLSKPNSAIFPRRKRLCADALLSSEASLYRGLKDLENKGYITREQIRLKFNGRYHLSPIRLSEKALTLLGIKNAKKKVIHKAPYCKMRDGLYKEHTNNKKHSLLKSLAKAKPQEICPKTKIPVPLLPFLQLGLSPAAICWLMAQAKKNSKRLEDVMISAWHCLSRLKGKSVVAYTLALLKKNQDFQVARTSLENKHFEIIRNETAQARLDTLNERFHGYSVVAKDGRQIGVFDSETQTVICSKGRFPANLRFGHALAEGEIRLIPQDNPKLEFF